jgi:hypothetical protein
MWIVDYPVAGKGGGRDRVSFVTLDQYQRWFQGKFHFSPDVPANATSPAGLRAPSVKEMKFDDAVKLGEYLRTQTVWLRELTRIFNLPRERQAKEIDDFIKVYRAETGIQIVMLDKATAETKYKLGPKNWGHYASEEKKIYMHPDVFDHPNSHVAQ